MSEFVAQVLRITEYLPSSRRRLDLILSRSLNNVEIVIEDTGEVKIVEEYRGEDEVICLPLMTSGGQSGWRGYGYGC